MQLTPINQTMSHIQIANLLGKRNDTVKLSMERLAESGVIQLTPMAEVNHKGQSFTAYHVTERDSYVVVAQLSPEFTAKLVDYWIAHKNHPQPQLSNPFTHEALKLKAFVDVGLLTKEEAIKAAGIKTTQEPRLQPPTYDRQAIKRDIIRYLEQNQGCVTRTQMERERRLITMHPHTRDLFREIVKELI